MRRWCRRFMRSKGDSLLTIFLHALKLVRAASGWSFFFVVFFCEEEGALRMVIRLSPDLLTSIVAILHFFSFFLFPLL